MTYCERIDNPQYRIDLAQLTKILRDSNAAAAALESNNGFSLDKAPNGKDSFLYLSLYDIISEKYPDLSEEEKIEKVIKLKLLTYSPEFKEWFGDWTIAAAANNDSLGNKKINILTPLKEEFKGKLIFAQSGSGKSSIADNITVIDSDYILASLLGTSVETAGLAIASLDRDTRNKISELYHQKIREEISKGKTVLTTARAMMKEADLIIINESAQLTDLRTSSPDRVGSNRFIDTKYQLSIIEEAESLSKEKPIIRLSEDQYLSSVLLEDSSFRIDTNKTTISSIEEVQNNFLKSFGITINEIKEYNGDISLFDALHRVINVQNPEQITDAVGYAVAFLMQNTPEFRELVAILQMSPGSVGRAFRKHENPEFLISDRVLNQLDKNFYIREIGNQIATELRKFYGKEVITKETTLLQKLWDFLEKFFEILTPGNKEKIRRLQSYTSNIVEALTRGDMSFIRRANIKPGTSEIAEKVDIEKAFKEHPYEASFVKALSKYPEITLAGSASIALQANVLRPNENPLHDLDFGASGLNKESIQEILTNEFLNVQFIRTIADGIDSTQTFLVLDRPFVIKSENPSSNGVLIDATTKEVLGEYVKSELVLKDGVQGKFLDFFTGPGANEFGTKTVIIEDSPIQVSNYKTAVKAKLLYGRPKDIWDYQRFIMGDNNLFGNLERRAVNFLGESTGTIDIADIINEDGSINFRVLEEITDEYFNNADETLFNKGRKTLRQRPEKHYDGDGNLIENNTLEHLQNVTKSALASNIRPDLKPQLVLAAALHDLAKPFHGGQIHGFQSLDLVNKLFKGNISPLVKFAIKHHMLTIEENKKFSIDDATRIMQEALDNNLNLDDAIEILLAINTADILSGQSEDSIDFYSKKSKKDTINEEIPFKKSLLIQAKNKLTNASKVVDENGEPLVVYHNSSAKFNTFDISLAKTPGDIYFTQSKSISDSNRYGKNVYPVFLSIKDLYDTRTADFSHMENSDGAFDPHHQGTYIVHNPNQIKSVENNGLYSPTDNNIYHEHFSDRVFNRTSTRDSKLTDYFTGENSTARSLEIPLKEFIEKLQDNPQYRGLYLLLHEKHLTTRKHSLIKETKIILDFPFLSTAEQQRSLFEGRRAYYDSKSHEIHINVESNFIDGNADSVIWHEIMHAMTVNRLQDPKAREKFLTILNDYLEVHYNPIYTGENGLEEFVADIWSDVSLVSELKQIPSKRTGFASIWDSIKSWLIEAFGLIEDNSLFAEASAELDRMFDEQELFVKESKFFEHINSLDQDTKDILSLIKYQYQIQYENPTEFKVNFENVIKGYLSGESWAIDLVKSLVDKVLIRLTLLHVLGYDYNEESYDENGVFEWEKYLGGIDLNKEIEELSEEDKLKFTPIENYQVSLAEIIMPKLYKTQFHLGNHSIAEIDKDFFKKTNSFYYSDLKTFSKEGLLESKAKIDFLVRCHNYKFNIVVSDSLSTPPAKNLKPIEVEVVDGYRMKNGERMYALPDRSEYLIYKDSKGNETIVFKNSESVESSIKDLIDSLDDKDLVSVLAFLENLEPTKDWLRYVMNINHIKTGNSSLKKLINENLTSDEIRKELLEIYYENSDIYKDLYGRRPNKYKEELAETLYNSFLKTLEVISVRIPTQAFLSIMAAKVVGFTNDDFNNVFVTRWLFWLLGSKY